MKPTIAQTVPYLLAAKNMFTTNPGVMTYYPSVGGTYFATKIQPAIDACIAIVTGNTLEETQKSETVIRNDNIDIILESVDDCELFVEGGILDGTITVSLGSFGFAAIRAACEKKDVGALGLAYNATTVVVAANQVALTALGYGPVRWGIITSAENMAYITMEYKIALKTEISELSVSNQVIINNALKLMARLIRIMNRYAKHIGNSDMQKAATQIAFLKSVRPTKAQKPRNRWLEIGESICVQQNPVLRNTLQFTLMTVGGSAEVGRMASKTGIVTAGTPLLYNTMVAQKFMSFPGVLKTDKCMIITNTGAKRIKVLFFTVKV